jgi:hypothetical protein
MEKPAQNNILIVLGMLIALAVAYFFVMGCSARYQVPMEGMLWPMAAAMVAGGLAVYRWNGPWWIGSGLALLLCTILLCAIAMHGPPRDGFIY